MKTGLHAGLRVLLVCTCAAAILDPNATVDLQFVRNLFRAHLNVGLSYTDRSCKKVQDSIDPDFNRTNTEAKIYECVTTSIMPNLAGLTQKHFYQMGRALVKLPKMTSIASFLPWKEELLRMCEVIPTLWDCFGNTTQPWIKRCWGPKYQSIFVYLGNLVHRICESQQSVRYILDVRFLQCLEKFQDVMKNCIKKSYKTFGNPCGITSCLMKSVQNCSILSVDVFIRRFLQNFQQHSGCVKGEYFFGINETSSTPIPTTEITTTTELTTTVTSSTNILAPSPTTLKARSQRWDMGMDRCGLLERNLERIWDHELHQIPYFFQQLDGICTEWQAIGLCSSQSEWTPFILSQCNVDPEPDAPSENCPGRALAARVDHLRKFCKRLDSATSVIGTRCANFFERSGSNEFLNGIFWQECPTDPQPSAQRSEAVAPLLWGILAIPVSIFSISLSIHCLTKRNGHPKKKEVEDDGSDQTLVSADSSV